MTGVDGGRKHHIDLEQFRILAGGGGDERAVGPLSATERSWRLTALLTLLESCRAVAAVTGPLAPIDSVWDLLLQAYRAEPAAVEDVLAQPQVGLWAAYTVRRMGARAPEVMWPEIGYLHGIVAACAFRAGVPYELNLPVRFGVAVLPTVGTADFPDGTTQTQAVFDGCVLTLSAGPVVVTAGPEDPRWHEPIQLEVEAGGQSIRVTLLDRDTFRDLRKPEPPLPLSVSDVDRWRELLGEAWKILVRELPERAAGIASSLRTLTPVPRQQPYRPQSATAAEAYGGILLSEPDDATQLAMTLVHEGQHLKLGALLHMFTLLERGPAVRYYAPWRDDPRPLEGLLQGVYAFAGIADFWRVHRRHAVAAEKLLAEFEFALWRRQAYGAVQVLSGSGRLTEIGQMFVTLLHDRLASWQDDPVSPRTAELAEDMALDHHALWRTYCMQVDKSLGEALAAAYRSGDPIPASMLSDDDRRVMPFPAEGLLDGRAVLVRHALAGTDPAAVHAARGNPSDVELVAGRTESARECYLRDVERNAGDSRAWVGLGLTLDRKSDPGAWALLGRPELVMAMATAGGRADPLAAARWLGHQLGGEQLGAPRPAGWRLA
ncbi:HEXXH motif domain-containing protein [Paractinoplanes abujensis]|uniref:HEXXH motif-containing protein n=1 Tax=Paractinoplanes abujensis TaxID=882441 RepID=A0A7W7FZ06_9ACTN|nr:HEXXH motif domain-containing protein [Actinoplanes abujensis]MBB4690159.1 HEXXH motif-containing protein [Actinoplanes abujensis]GID20927.1 HEXXH motif domain-containing protein [Actinoplanes abujensis]